MFSMKDDLGSEPDETLAAAVAGILLLLQPLDLLLAEVQALQLPPPYLLLPLLSLQYSGESFRRTG